MNRIIKTITACVLMLVMTAISPMTDLSQSLNKGENTGSGTGASVAKAAETAKAAESDNASGELYISAVKIGQGKTEAEARKQLDEGGYTILTDDSGKPADLNKGAGERGQSGFGPGNRIVYLGYKVTDDPKYAITDLAVMNMKGGYSIQDYEVMMKTNLETRIKPFVERFITTIEEYRENLKKPKDSLNYKRADFSRKLMNYLVDDDTGKKVGDLLVEKTKYEMGDDAYNALSDSEKKNHADILTLLMQGNGQAILTIETMLSQASDTDENSWFDRFKDTDLDTMTDEIKEKNPSLSTKSQVNAELDKKYQDSAKQLLGSWEAMGDLLDDPDGKGEDAIDSLEERSEEREELKEKIEDLDKDSNKEIAEAIAEDYAVRLKTETDVMNLRASMIGQYLDSIEYGDGTALDFFRKNADDFSGSKIRELYPIVASLSDGQIAGLEFLSMMDLLSIAFQDESAYEQTKLPDVTEASVYEDVDREIYEPGGVALTNDALRKGALEDEGTDPLAIIKPLTIISYVATLASGIITGLCVAKYMKEFHHLKMVDALPDELLSGYNISNFQFNFKATEIVDEVDDVMDEFLITDSKGFTSSGGQFGVGEVVYTGSGGAELISEEFDEITGELVDEIIDNDEYQNLANQTEAARGSTTLWKGLSIAFSVITLALLAFSIYSTFKDILAYYHVDLTPIPKFMVEETDITAYNDKGERIVLNNQTAYYRIVTTNREKGDTEREKDSYEILGDRSDLNGDVGRQWLALYFVKYRDGEPILANSLKYVNGNLSGDYATGIHEFGSKVPMNLNKKMYLFADDPPAIYVCFNKAEHTVSSLLSAAKNPGAAGSLFAEGSAGGNGSDSRITPAGIALGGGIGIILGGLLGVLFMYFARKRKKEVPYE